ncbi:FecR family protein [Prolixibacteraceae bacterium JC049]|nr:FecR family protein [Prolixibacteraceae bacterium JC049]
MSKHLTDQPELKQMKTNRPLDFKHIWNRFHQTDNSCDAQEIEDWMKDDPKRKTFYTDAESYFQKGSQFKHVSNQHNQYRRLWKKILWRKTLKNMRNIAAFLLFILGTYWGINRTMTPAEETPTLSKITPGTNKAILHLDDGSQYELAQSKPITIKEKGTLIKSDGNKIQYKKTAHSSVKKAFNKLSVPKGGQFFLVLEDSSKIWLNSDSYLKYPVVFDKNNRTIELTGEAYLEVFKDATRPFYLKTANQTIEVLGTEFNITAYSSDNFVTTTLVEGKVAINTNNSSTVTLSPSEQAILSCSTGEIITEKVNPIYYTGWKSGKYYFKDESLENLFNTLARWYNIEVEFENNNSKHICFTGSFNRDQQLENIIKIIESANNIKIDAYGNKLTIY